MRLPKHYSKPPLLPYYTPDELKAVHVIDNITQTTYATPLYVSNYKVFDCINPFLSDVILTEPDSSYSTACTIKTYKRNNTNTLFTSCHMTPSVIGKIRKMTIEFDRVIKPFQLGVKIISKNAKNSLMVSENDRIHKTHDSNHKCITYTIRALKWPQIKTVFFKPYFTALDFDKFEVVVYASDLQTGKTEILHTWHTQVHRKKSEATTEGLTFEPVDAVTSLSCSFRL